MIHFRHVYQENLNPGMQWDECKFLRENNIQIQSCYFGRSDGNLFRAFQFIHPNLSDQTWEIRMKRLQKFTSR